jgi:hypothetical protein
MEQDGMEFEEQLGSGFFFKNENKRITASGRQYSRYFYLFELPSS